MSCKLKSFQSYIQALQKELATGNTTEHTHRPALKTLIESLTVGVVATNEPGRIKCGAPDFVVTKGALTIGYIEAKDIGKSIDEAEKTDQLSDTANRSVISSSPTIWNFAGMSMENNVSSLN